VKRNITLKFPKWFVTLAKMFDIFIHYEGEIANWDISNSFFRVSATSKKWKCMIFI